jgi:4-diphosphocytidyl-2-C-methyl-D-erythritol kinase
VTGWHELSAPAKLNLALVVGPQRGDGKHEVVTVLERLTLADTVRVRRAAETRVAGFDHDTLVRAALDALAAHADGEPRFEAELAKRIPVAAGLGGGSSDAAAALALANGLLDTPLPANSLASIAAAIGADVPFFLQPGAQVATGDGTTLAPVVLPREYGVLLALPRGAVKSSTADVYAAFDARSGERGFEERCDRLLRALDALATSADLAALPPNDLVASPLTAELDRLGAFRADVTGAGPVAYGLFPDRESAEAAEEALSARVAASWVAEPG